MELFLLCIPWISVGLYLILFVRIPRALPPPSPDDSGEFPFVSIIVPARNEEVNIPPLLDSLTSLDYPGFEILVVDDESGDKTRELVEVASLGNASELRLIRGKPLPEGWLGKPWACHQAVKEAKGQLLLFTDADTVHAPKLLQQAVRGLVEEKADTLTIVGQQIMGSFWERLVQPQIFMLLAARFPRIGTVRSRDSWQNAIANGQYLLFRREVYEALGGHEAVKGEVVEDMRLAQLLVKGGWRLVVMEGLGLRTRMYRSLPGLIEGWSKNITTGALQTVPRWLLPVILPLSLLIGFTLWLMPPGILAWALLTGAGGTALHFGTATVGFGVLLWCTASAVMRGNPLYGFLYPLGAAMGAFIFLKSWLRGNRIEWKGREYSVSLEARQGESGRDIPSK